jgi:hypothetical protein
MITTIYLLTYLHPLSPFRLPPDGSTNKLPTRTRAQAAPSTTAAPSTFKETVSYPVTGDTSITPQVCVSFAGPPRK